MWIFLNRFSRCLQCSKGFGHLNGMELPTHVRSSICMPTSASSDFGSVLSLAGIVVAGADVTCKHSGANGSSMAFRKHRTVSLKSCCDLGLSLYLVEPHTPVVIIGQCHHECPFLDQLDIFLRIPNKQ